MIRTTVVNSAGLRCKVSLHYRFVGLFFVSLVTIFMFFEKAITFYTRPYFRGLLQFLLFNEN